MWRFSLSNTFVPPTLPYVEGGSVLFLHSLCYNLNLSNRTRKHMSDPISDTVRVVVVAI